MTVVACLKWVDHKPDVDPLTGAVQTDWRTSGMSDADRAALEWALRLGAAWGSPVVAMTAGPAPAGAVLAEALSVGAARAVRVDLPADAPSDVVAASIARSVRGVAHAVLCGVWSLDRGSGSVPAFLAAELGAAQALGLVSLSPSEGSVLAERRLDRGARERLRVPLPAVCSVEGASARLRRASLPGVLAATAAGIDVVAGTPVEGRAPVRTGPFRPRARELPAPAAASARERVLALTGVLTHREPPQTLVLTPGQAADALLARLEGWGYFARSEGRAHP
jgi:electron transfer flavoprotein beta subunit